MSCKSKQIYNRACTVIPGGVNSPVRSFRHLNRDPLIAESGCGAILKDVDGNEYIDFCNSWGALILGHAHPTVVNSVIEQVKKGSSFGLLTEVEEKIAKKITTLLPHVEKVRFVNSGTEATMTAIRLARGFTGRSKIIKFSGHYHGHSDPFLIQAGSGALKINPLATSKGVNLSTIRDTICIPFNDTDALRSVFLNSEDIAAVILEPVAGNMGVIPPSQGFLELLKELTQKNGALLIFDEVITGFRVGLEGAAGRYQIQPDLTCLGKIIGGGFPVAAVGGTSQIMDHLAPLGQVYQAGTLSGNPVAMQAGLATLNELETPGFYKALDSKVDRMIDPILSWIEKKQANICLNRVGSMFNLFFGVKKVESKKNLKNLNEEIFIQFFNYMLKKGVYLSPSSHEAWFISAVHSNEQIDYTSKVMIDFLEEFL